MKVERLVVTPDKYVDDYYCDNCGKKIKNHTMFYIVCHGPATYSKDDDVVRFESKIEGDYCPKCQYIMSRVFYDLMKDVFAERYEKASLETDKRIFDYAKEHELDVNIDLDWKE